MKEKKIDVYITARHNYCGSYRAEIGKHEIDLEEGSVIKLNDMVQGKWEAEFDGGEIKLSSWILWPYKPNRCQDCGAKIVYYRTWCDDCLMNFRK